MFDNDLKAEYAQLLTNGKLFELFPWFTGNWEDDKEYWLSMVENNIF